MFFSTQSYSGVSPDTFESWLISFKKLALKKGISNETIEIVFKDVKFLDQVIKYDRKQPEFFEDTKTYVSKRANNIRKNTTIGSEKKTLHSEGKNRNPKTIEN